MVLLSKLSLFYFFPIEENKSQQNNWIEKKYKSSSLGEQAIYYFTCSFEIVVFEVDETADCQDQIALLNKT